MSDMASALSAHQRLSMLRELAQLPGYSAHDTYLQGVLKGLGTPAVREDVREHLVWLAQRQLVTLELPGDDDGPVAATLAEQGIEVVTGVRVVEGVQTPMPHQVRSAVMAASTQEAIDRLTRRRDS